MPVPAAGTPPERPLRLGGALLPALAAAMVANLWLIFFYAPTEREMGEVQRIFYFHVPAAIMSFLAFFVVFAGSILFLATSRRAWDRLAQAAAEVGVLFCTLVLISGPIWARPVWGVWWTWEVRLTTTLILWLIYLAYLLVRSYAENPDQGAKFAAVLGIVGFLDVPIIWFSVRLFRGLHPTVLRVQGGGGLDPEMRRTFLFSLFTFFLLFLHLLRERARLGRFEWESECLAEELRRPPLPARAGPLRENRP
ncbi:MAG: cytochrome c biogenesis protein CcsA [Acidobacteria bacterium]|nr:cytochrome c biogenesis protein CcsA [Acidobacteriota bacterium]